MGVDTPFEVTASDPVVSTVAYSGDGTLPLPGGVSNPPVVPEPYYYYYYSDYNYEYYDSMDPYASGPGSYGSYYESYYEYQEPEVEWLTFVPVISFKMAFTTLTFQGLNTTSGAGPAFCDFYRCQSACAATLEMISNLAFVETLDVQLKTIAPNPLTSQLEILTRVKREAVAVVPHAASCCKFTHLSIILLLRPMHLQIRLEPVDVAKLVDEQSVAFPGPEEDTLANVWATLQDFESKLTKVNLLKAAWDDPRLPLGTLM
eukprot:scaffold656400_cov65-Prasinocladus_malaysianus.AAC.1